MWKDEVTTRRKPRAKEPERQRVSLNLSAALFQNAIVPSGSFVQGFILIVRNRGNSEHSSEKGRCFASVCLQDSPKPIPVQDEMPVIHHPLWGVGWAKKV